MLDIDHFKRFNDTYGHACGDYVLQQVAKIISEGVRNHDLAARYGGEEFVVLLGNTDAPSAMMVAERIRKNIEACDFNYENQHMTVTISIGVAVLQPGKKISPAKLVEYADEALYISKNNGRNRSTFAPQH
jgi:diguanylate cyclase (GGDEF)-like protein